MTLSERISSKVLFLRNFIKHPLRNASIIPSSPAACQLILNEIDFSKVNTIVELGPGNGEVTELIIKKCSPKTKMIIVEIEQSYIKSLKKKFGKKIIIETECASKLSRIIKKHGIKEIDVIISGLPFLPKEVRKKVHAEIKKHTDKGAILRFFTYMPNIMRIIYHRLPVKKKGFTWKNIPPMWVYGIN